MRSTIYLLIVASLSLFGPAALGADIKLTVYGDGESCPAGCDAHVVFDPALNGTEHAHSPDSSSGAFTKCTKDKVCRVCFEAGAKGCVDVMYRGAGPAKNRFDFTQKFYDQECPKQQLPRALRATCEEFKKASETLGKRVSCIRDQAHAKCTAMMAAAIAAKEADRPAYDECRRLGEEKFNRQRPPVEQRRHDCAYERNRSDRGWLKLLPAACAGASFVGRDGLDCCTGDPAKDGPLGVECKGFYVTP